MSWINKFNAIFFWVFSLSGIIVSIAIVLIFCFLNFCVFRYKRIDDRIVNNDTYSLSVDKYKSRCVVCQSGKAPSTNHHYVLKKNNKIILRWKMTCYHEGYNSHPYIFEYKDDTIIIGDKKADCLVLLNVFSNGGKFCLSDVRFEFIDKSGPSTLKSNINLEKNRYCYEDY